MSAVATKDAARAHYQALAAQAIAQAMASDAARLPEFIGPMLEYRIEDARFCITGSTFSQPVQSNVLHDGFYLSDCGSLDAPLYIPSGAISNKFASKWNFASTTMSEGRERTA